MHDSFSQSLLKDHFQSSQLAEHKLIQVTFCHSTTGLLQASSYSTPLLETQIPYLFELRHPVPKPNFDGVPPFKKIKELLYYGQCYNSPHEEDLDCEQNSPGH